MTLFQAFLSLSKLSLLASRPSEGVKSKQLDILNTFLQHIEVQEELPPDVVAASGMDYDTMPPLSPQRIIEVSINNIHTYSGTWKKVDGLRRSCGTIWPKFCNGCQSWSCHWIVIELLLCVGPVCIHYFETSLQKLGDVCVEGLVDAKDASRSWSCWVVAKAIAGCGAALTARINFLQYMSAA